MQMNDSQKDALLFQNNLQFLHFLSEAAIVQFNARHETMRYIRPINSSIGERNCHLASVLGFLEGQVALEMENLSITIKSQGETEAAVADRHAVFQAWRNYHNMYSMRDLEISLEQLQLLDDIIVRLGAALGEGENRTEVHETKRDAVDAPAPVCIKETISAQDANSSTCSQSPVFGEKFEFRVSVTIGMIIIFIIISFVKLILDVNGAFSYPMMPSMRAASIALDLVQCFTNLMVVQIFYIMIKRLKVFSLCNGAGNDRNHMKSCEYADQKDLNTYNPHLHLISTVVSPQQEKLKETVSEEARCVGGRKKEDILGGSMNPTDSDAMRRTRQSVDENDVSSFVKTIAAWKEIDVDENVFKHNSNVYFADYDSGGQSGKLNERRSSVTKLVEPDARRTAALFPRGAGAPGAPLSFPECLQVPKELPRLYSEGASGVGLQKLAPLVREGPAKVCRALTDRLSDALCPLVVVECHRPPWAQTPSHAEARGAARLSAGPPRYSVVYSSLAAIDALRCRWSTDLAGKDMRSVFTLYRNRHRPQQQQQQQNKKTAVRGGSATPSLPQCARNVSALPALPQARTPGNIHVPTPPSTVKKLGVWNRRSLEEIADMQGLFENGAEESITVLATQAGTYFDVYAMGVDNIVFPPGICDQRQNNPAQQSSLETLGITATEIGSVVEEAEKGSDNKLYLVLLFVRPLERDELEPHQEQQREPCPEHQQKPHHQQQQKRHQLKPLFSENDVKASSKLSLSARSPSTHIGILSRTSIDSTRLGTALLGNSECNIRRASTANLSSVSPTFLSSHNSAINMPTTTTLRVRPHIRHKSMPVGKRSKRRIHDALLSAERGRTADRFTPQQLQEKLESLAAVREVKVTSNVPDVFFFNFMALMIFFQRILKQCRSVVCHVDAENMEIKLEVIVFEMTNGNSTDGDAFFSLTEVAVPDRKAVINEVHTLPTAESVLSTNLREYLLVCDASLQFHECGCVLRFPYITQERLDLMEDMTTVQLSKTKSLSLFGIAAANALTEEAVAKTSEEKQSTQQVPHTEGGEGSSEALQKTAPLIALHEEPASPHFPDIHIDEIYGSSVSFFGVQPIIDEVSSSPVSTCGLPMVLGGVVQRNLDAMTLAAAAAKARATVSAAVTMQPSLSAYPGRGSITPESLVRNRETLMERTTSKTGSEMTPAASDIVEKLSDNIFAQSRARRTSDQMSPSVSYAGNLHFHSKPSTRYLKRYFHVFLFLKEPRPDVLQHLYLHGHVATAVTEPAVLKQHLLVGLHLFDVIFIEWSEKTATSEVRDLITSRVDLNATTFFVLSEGERSPLLPSGTPHSAVLRVSDIADAFTDPTLGHNIGSCVRLHQLRCEMDQMHWFKKYQIVRQLGGGAFGDVFEVYLYVSRGRLAMKRFLINGVGERTLEQLNREVLIMKQLDHTNVVSFSHTCMEDNSYCIFMELCDGTLAQRIQAVNTPALSKEQHQEQEQGERLSKGGAGPISITSRVPETPPYRASVIPPFPATLSFSLNPTATLSDMSSKTSYSLTSREIVLLLRDIATGIAYIHSQGIVHRDIKPCNILFVNGVAKIGDFGSAAEERVANPLVNMKGTLSYMSPEVLLGEPYGKPCDMWSFGCLVAEVIGLRLGHLHGLHMPALVELYRSIPLSGSLPVTVANHHGPSVIQSHYGDSTASHILGAMKSALLDSESERFQASLCGASPKHKYSSLSTRDKSQTFMQEGEKECHFKGSETCTEFGAMQRSSMTCDITRAVTCISTTSTCFLNSEKAQLPDSLVDLFEKLFRRDPKERMTAESVLDHPVTWDAEWMEMILQAVEEICPHEGPEHMGNASACTDISPQEEVLDLSFSSVAD